MRQGFSLTFVHKLTSVGGTLIGTCIIWSGMVESSTISLALIGVSYLGLMKACCAVWSLVSDITPGGKASVLAGLQNNFSNAGGVMGPVVTGFIVYPTGFFTAALAVSGVEGLIGAIIYLLMLGRVEPLRLKANAKEQSGVPLPVSSD